MWYRPIEALLGCAYYTYSLDIWSAGCIFAEMLRIGIPIFPGDSEIDQIYMIFRTFGTPDEDEWPGVTSLPDYKKHFPKWPKIISEKLLKTNKETNGLLLKMLVCNPAHRITASESLDHEYFSCDNN